MTALDLNKENLTLVANTIRFLSADGVEKANSGHPGMPMGMADLAAVLWLKYLKFNPQDPKWPSRDRFVLSNGHGSMLLYSMLHLAGYNVTLEDLKQFRQWESKTPGHPESHMTEGVETTTGPLGQGISNAVGLALAQKMMTARYSSDGVNPIDHNVFVFCGDGCLMEGVSSEASSLAGHLGLGNLIVIYDDNGISIAGHTELAFTEDVAKRYEAYGFHTMHIDGHDYEAIDRAIAVAIQEKDRPSLILAKTIIGKGSPNKCDTHDVHGAPLGKSEMELTKKALNWPLEPTFYVPEEVRSLFAARVEELKTEYGNWQNLLSTWKGKNPDLSSRLDSQLKREIPKDLEEKLIAALPKEVVPVATRKLSETVLQAASAAVDCLVGGSADLEPSTLTLIKKSTDIKKGQFSGLNIRFGVREHGMGSIMNGLSYYGSYIPYGSTFLCFLDYMKPTVRLAAVSHLPALFIYTHDSIFLGEDGPTHQPIEHLGMLRSIPNVHMFRPADGLETAVCYAQAIKRTHGPSALIFTRHNLDPIERAANFSTESIRKGAYSVLEPQGGGEPDMVFISTGSEVGMTIKAAKQLAGSAKIRVVSMPCYDAFAEQPESYRRSLIPMKAKKVTVEAASTFGWLGMVEGSSENTLCIGIDHFGASAPANIIAENFGLTADKIAEKVKSRFL